MELAEAILLSFSDLVDRFPSNNISMGAENSLRQTVDKENLLKLNIYNYNLFEHPKNSSLLDSKIDIKVSLDEDVLDFSSILRKRKKSKRF